MAKTVALVWDDRKAYFFKGDERFGLVRLRRCQAAAQ